jgi:hypothetical protein
MFSLILLILQQVSFLNMLQFEVFTPFIFSPRGEKNTPSPLGEGWEGGKIPRKNRKIKLIIIKVKI